MAVQIKEIPPLLRIKDVLAVVPVSRPYWFRQVRAGRFPKPIYPFGEHIAFWRGEDIAALINNSITITAEIPAKNTSNEKPRFLRRG